jgi:hypothetical protein
VNVCVCVRVFVCVCVCVFVCNLTAAVTEESDLNEAEDSDLTGAACSGLAIFGVLTIIFEGNQGIYQHQQVQEKWLSAHIFLVMTSSNNTHMMMLKLILLRSKL